MKSAEILVVYEDMPVLSLIAGALEFQGHRVTVTKDARSSAAALDRKTYNLIILKLSRGPEAAAVLNRLKPQTKLIILSEEQKLPEEAYQAEVEDYIFLPCRAAEIWRRIADPAKRLEFQPVPKKTTNHLHPVNRQVYHQLVSIFNDMRISLLSMASVMQLLHQKVRCRDDQESEDFCQQAYKNNQELLAIVREIEEPFVRIGPGSPFALIHQFTERGKDETKEIPRK